MALDEQEGLLEDLPSAGLLHRVGVTGVPEKSQQLSRGTRLTGGMRGRKKRGKNEAENTSAAQKAETQTETGPDEIRKPDLLPIRADVCFVCMRHPSNRRLLVDSMALSTFRMACSMDVLTNVSPSLLTGRTAGAHRRNQAQGCEDGQISSWYFTNRFTL